MEAVRKTWVCLIADTATRMIYVIACITVKASERDNFIEIFKANTPKVLEEEGCLEYSATVDFQTELPIQQMNANVLTVIEKWESFPHLEAHCTAHAGIQGKGGRDGGRRFPENPRRCLGCERKINL